MKAKRKIWGNQTVFINILTFPLKKISKINILFCKWVIIHLCRCDWMIFHQHDIENWEVCRKFEDFYSCVVSRKIIKSCNTSAHNEQEEEQEESWRTRNIKWSLKNIHCGGKKGNKVFKLSSAKIVLKREIKVKKSFVFLNLSFLTGTMKENENKLNWKSNWKNLGKI